MPGLITARRQLDACSGGVYPYSPVPTRGQQKTASGRQWVRVLAVERRVVRHPGLLVVRWQAGSSVHSLPVLGSSSRICTLPRHAGRFELDTE